MLWRLRDKGLVPTENNQYASEEVRAFAARIRSLRDEIDELDKELILLALKEEDE
jgi:hypothetical protein